MAVAGAPSETDPSETEDGKTKDAFVEIENHLRGPRFDDELQPADRCRYLQAEGQAFTAFNEGGVEALETDFTDAGVYAQPLRLLPEAGKADLFCSSCTLGIVGDCGTGTRSVVGCRLVEVGAGRELPLAWVFVRNVVFRRRVSVCECRNELHEAGQQRLNHPRGVAWSKKTGLFNVKNKWFFSLLLLEEITSAVCASTPAAPASEIERTLRDIRATMGKEVVMPPAATAVLMMRYAWYSYEYVLKQMPTKYATCPYCGFFPKLGLDADAKIAMNLGQDHQQAMLRFSDDVDLCKLCEQPLGTNGGKVQKLPCTCRFCKGCLAQYQRSRSDDNLNLANTIRNAAHAAVQDGQQAQAEPSLLSGAKRARGGAPPDAESERRAKAVAHARPPSRVIAAPPPPPGGGNNAPSRGNSLSSCPTCPICDTSYQDFDLAALEEDSPHKVWTQDELMKHRARDTLVHTYTSSRRSSWKRQPLEANKLTPLWYDQKRYAGDQLFNTTQLKGRGRGDSGQFTGKKGGPTTQSLLPVE